MRVKRRAVSTIIAELLLIAMTVAIGTLVYSFASAAFGSFGTGFTGFVSSSGDTLSEHLIVEQVSFTYNSTCACSDLYLRNVGLKPVTILAVYISNVTANLPVPVCPSASPCATVQWPSGFPATPITVQPGHFVQVKILFVQDSGKTYGFVVVTSRGNEVIAYEKA